MAGSRRVARIQSQRLATDAAQAAIVTRAAGYVRVSTDDQAKGFGPEMQDKAVRAFAESQGYELVDVVADDGVSGATVPAERPGYGKLLQLAAAGAFNVLLVWKFDRLARQIVYAVNAVDQLARNRIAIRSVTEPIDTATPMGRTIFAVLAGMAEQERQSITERTWSGRRAKAHKGGFAGGGTPYGYRRDLEGGLVVDEREAAIVREIFRLRNSGLANAAIARTLNALGKTTRIGSPWRHGGIAYILDNPKYHGDVEYLFRWSGPEQLVLQRGAHQPIISTEADDARDR